MRTVRFLVPLAIAALGLLVLPSVATADPYPIGSPSLVMERSSVTVGEQNTAFGSGFGANDTVTINTSTNPNAAGPAGQTLVPVAYTVQRRAVFVVQADGQGNFSVTWTVDEVGLVTVTASGLPSGVSATATFRAFPRGGGLPVTGQSGTALRIALVGSAVAAIGVVLLVLVRSRRRRTGTHQA